MEYSIFTTSLSPLNYTNTIFTFIKSEHFYNKFVHYTLITLKNNIIPVRTTSSSPNWLLSYLHHYSTMHSTSDLSRKLTTIFSCSNTTIFSAILKYKSMLNYLINSPSPIISINSLAMYLLSSSPSSDFHFSIKYSLFSIKALKLLTKALYKISSSICLFLRLTSPFSLNFY